MTSQLAISVGQYSDKGRKTINQDFHGICIPKEPMLGTKGIAMAVADGISSSDVSQIASQAAVTSFLEDYYCTSEAWSVKTSIERVLAATNSWLHSQTRQSQYRDDKERGYVCTLSAMVIKSTTAHIFHVGDARIYHLRGDKHLEQLTTDHRVWVSSRHSYLSRALGIHPRLDIDYQTVQVETGDIFLFVTDGVHECADEDYMLTAIRDNRGTLDEAARMIAEEARRQGSGDNLTVQIIAVEELPSPDVMEMYRQFSELPFPPSLAPRMLFDGYRIVREIHVSNRSHVYLAVDMETNAQVVIKTPSIDLRGDQAYLERFLMEEWISRRIDSAYVLKPCTQTRKRHFIYIAMEYIEGQTLAQWMIDNPRPPLETVRGIVEQIARGLRAFHRLEMVHQDLRPENVMIDSTGTVRIIDFGATRVAGIEEMLDPGARHDLLGTVQYTAPEYFLGEIGTARSDMFSLAVMTYQMLTGSLPYGTQVAKSRTREAQRKLHYRSAFHENGGLPPWVDEAIRKATQPDPGKRYDDLSEFIHDLHYPNRAFLSKSRPPLIERHPVAFWRGVSLILMAVVLMLLATR